MNKRFLGSDQKKQQRKTKEWINNLSVEDSKRMNIKKDSFDLSTGNIIKTFGDYFKNK